MTRDDTLGGVDSRTVETDRLETHYLESGGSDRAAAEGETILFCHGNVSSSRFFEDVLVDLPARHRAIAPDLRGYGDSETKPVDATNGLGDFAADLRAFVDALALAEPLVIVGWSNGGGVAMRYAIDHPRRSPRSCWSTRSRRTASAARRIRTERRVSTTTPAPAAGSVTTRSSGLENRDRSEEGQTSPRKVLRTYYVDPTHEFDSEREESYLTGMLDTATGDKNYPGSSKSSDNWPGIAPGETGVNNAISPKYCELEAITEIDPDEKPPVLWIRGDSDQIVSNASLFDLGTLGRMDELPEWPGEDVFPPQPMVGQTRAVLERYADRGGEFEEVVFGNVGHTPHVEVPGTFWIGSSPSCRAGSRGSGVVQRPELCSGTPPRTLLPPVRRSRPHCASTAASTVRAFGSRPSRSGRRRTSLPVLVARTEVVHVVREGSEPQQRGREREEDDRRDARRWAERPDTDSRDHVDEGGDHHEDGDRREHVVDGGHPRVVLDPSAVASKQSYLEPVCVGRRLGSCRRECGLDRVAVDAAPEVGGRVRHPASPVEPSNRSALAIVKGFRKAATSISVWTTIEPPVTTSPINRRFALRISIAFSSISWTRST